MRNLKNYISFINSLFEGVADISSEKQFGILNPAKQRDIIALKGLKTFNEIVGVIDGVSIFRNPKNLLFVNQNVRAVSDKNGNLFIIQSDGYTHSDIENAVNKMGKYKLNNASNPRETIQWYRIKNTNTFGFSITFVEYFNKPKSRKENRKEALERVEAVQMRNPQFNFVPIYWEKLLKNIELR